VEARGNIFGMTPCPVCETPNAVGARECATCGRALVVAAPIEVAAGGFPEIERGRIDGSAIPTVAEVMPELDLGRSAAVNVAADVTPDLDLGRAPAVNAAVEVTPDMERTAVSVKEWTPLTSGPVACRACGAPQTDLSSIFCANCGRRLPVIAAVEGVVLTETDAAPAVDRVRCFSCGGKVRPAELCSDCGMPLRVAARG
jgi:hypothetical protein